MTDITITASARDWVALRQTHLAAVMALKEHGEIVGALVGAMLGKGFEKAVRETAVPPVSELIDGQDDDRPMTVTLNKYLFSGVFSSLEAAYQAAESDEGEPLPDDVVKIIQNAWVQFKAEAILAEVG